MAERMHVQIDDGTENSETDRKQFTCGICIEYYKNPRYLPTCGHTFCENCLLTHASNLQQQGSKLDCPICRKSISYLEDIQVTREWVQTFPLNSAIIKMMDHDAGSELEWMEQKTADVQRVCDPCKERGETVVGLKYCMDCQEVYCMACTDSHKSFKKLKNHSLIDIYEISADHASREEFFTSFTKCLNHPEREVEFFCKTHDAVICKLCPTNNHKLCDVVEIISFDADDSMLREKSEMVTSQLTAVIDHLNLLKQFKEANKMDMKKKLKEIREKVEQMRDQVVALMDNVVQHVTETTKQIELETGDRLDADMSRMSEMKLQAEEKVDLLDTIRQYGSKRHHFISAHTMKTQIEELGRKIWEEDKRLKNIDAEMKVADDFMKFIENTDMEKLVQITVNEKESGHNYLDAVLNYLRDSKLVRVEGHSVSRSASCRPRYLGISLCKDGRVLLCDRDSEYVCLYNPANRTIQELHLNHRSTSATQINDTHLAVSIRDDKAISIVSVGNELKVERVIKTQHNAWRIVALSSGQLAVVWSDPSAFGIIDISRTDIVQTSYFDEDNSGRKLEKFDFMAVDEKRQHVIQTVNGTDIVCCYSFSGELVFRYSDPNLENVRGVALDKCGNIYVCSCVSPGSIHKLSPTGEQIAIITEGIPPYPWAICCDNAGTGFWMTNDQVSPEKILYFRLEETT